MPDCRCGWPNGYWPYTGREVRSFLGARREPSVVSIGRKAHFSSAVVAYVQVRIGLVDRPDRKDDAVHLAFLGLRKYVPQVRFRGCAFLPGRPVGWSRYLYGHVRILVDTVIF